MEGGKEEEKERDRRGDGATYREKEGRRYR